MNGLAGYPATGQVRCYDVAGREVPCAGSGQDAGSRRGEGVNGRLPNVVQSQSLIRRSAHVPCAGPAGPRPSAASRPTGPGCSISTVAPWTWCRSRGATAMVAVDIEAGLRP